MSAAGPAQDGFGESLALALAEGGGALLAQGVLGAAGRIDWVARLAGGRVAVVIDARSDPVAALGRALMERSWLAPRVADWARLAPERGLSPERGAGALLVGGRLPDALRAAAAEAGVELLELVRVDGRWRRPDGATVAPPVPAPLLAASPAGTPAEPPAAPLRSVFRSGLRP